MTAIEISGVSKRYGQTTALENINLNVKQGSITGLLGPNGAGKSTLMRLICGLETPQSGSITVQPNQHSDSRISIGTLLTPEWLEPRLTVSQTIRFQSKLSGLRLTEADLNNIIERIGLSQAEKRRVKDLSLGMRQRLALGVALLGNPPILILDEPVNGLDPQGVRWIRNLLSEYAADGNTVLISSHLISELSLIATDVAIINEGRLGFSGPITALQGDQKSSLLIKFADEIPFTTFQDCLPPGSTAQVQSDGFIKVSGFTAPDFFDFAAGYGFRLRHMEESSLTLEDSYFEVIHSTSRTP